MQYQYPFKGRYKRGTCFGKAGRYWRCGYHAGADFKSTNYGGDGVVYPICSGRVEKITQIGSYGNCVYLRHDDGYLSLYAHLSKIAVKKGQRVDLNTALGREGTTGNSTGIHLHLEVHKHNYAYPATIDPDKLIKAKMEEEAVKIKKLTVLCDGQKITVEAVEVEGNNFIKLRDLEQLSPMAIGYDGQRHLVTVNNK